MLLPQIQYKSRHDCMFVQKLREIFSDNEIRDVIKTIESENGIDIKDSEKIELFFQKIRKNLDNSWYDSVVCLCNSFDVDVQNILDKTFIFDKIKAELKPDGRDLKELGIF